jgi:ribosomal protein L32
MTSILVPAACLVLLGVFLTAVVHPILTRKGTWQRATGTRRQRLELTERKEQVYASIKEMEFDHSLGKISETDYDALRGGLEGEAVEILRRIDALAGDGDDPVAGVDARIERDIAAQRQAAVASAPSDHAFCHNCGESRTSAHRFCPHCGQSFALATS